MQTKYRIIPTRIGRHDNLDSFTVVVPDSDGTDGQRLAEGLHSFAKDYLLSREFDVYVDLRKGIFEIDRGRFGKGRIEIKEQTNDEPDE